MIQLTEAAAVALRGLLDEEEAKDHGLRLQIVGGGCEGLYYDLSVQAKPVEGDEVFDSRGIKLFVDPRALPLLSELTIDYRDGFRFDNPSARRSCRCGASFH